MDIHGAEFTNFKNNAGWWVRSFMAKDLSHLNPLKVVADGVEGARANMGNVVIGVFSSVSPDGRTIFYILARIIGAAKTKGSAEDMIDPTCQV